MQIILSFTGTLNSSSCTVKPFPKPSTQPRQVASLRMRTASAFHSLSILEQTCKKLLPDLLISGCSALFEPTLPGEQTKLTAIRVKTESKRMEPPSVERELYSEEFLFLFPVSFTAHLPFLFFSARIFAHRAFAAFEIFALPAADRTRFLTCLVFRTTEFPSAFLSFSARNFAHRAFVALEIFAFAAADNTRF